MQDITYFGEHLLPGQIGHLCLLTGFVFAILSAYAYSRQSRITDGSVQWLSLGRWSFGIHSVATIGTIGTLFYIMLNRYYEYQYAWAHVSDDLPFAYIFSAFWEDQPGSFLLWAFWHVILGLILIRKAGQWEAPVLVVMAALQAFILSMLLGLYLMPGNDDLKIGYNPFMLLRDTMDAPIFSNADYLQLITGKGLNPLLQNYWNTIHPPTLFLGFASTSVPFAYAMAALAKRDFTGWLKPVLPWALFNGAILGIGILMGSAWAYEALSFGGYWAWDPVENMSLVPWIVLVAGIHTNLIARSTGHSIKTTLVFYALALILILFSTFLTRSGVLQDSSVHAFTELGLEWQLVIFILFFIGWFIWRYVRVVRKIPVKETEEATGSREFWMFIGSLVLFFSALLITFTTSIPVYNKLADALGWIMGQDMSSWHRSMPVDPITHYNRYQFWIAVFIGVLSGFAIYLRYTRSLIEERLTAFVTRLGIHILIAGILTFLTWWWLDYSGWAFHILALASWFTVTANADYLIFFLRGRMAQGAATISHIGFGLMIIGIMASGLKKQHISQNRFAMEGLLNQEMIDRNVLLFKDSPLYINGYEVTYLSDTLVGHTRTYEIAYVQRNEAGEIIDRFTVHPNILFDKDFTKQAASNPSTKRYLTKDVFSHIAGLPNEQADIERAKIKEDSLRYLMMMIRPTEQDTLEDLVVKLDRWDATGTHPDYEAEIGDQIVTARLLMNRIDEDSFVVAMPMIVLRDNLVFSYPAKVDRKGAKVRLNDQVFEGYLTPDDSLSYRPVVLGLNESFDYEGYRITLSGFDKSPEHPQFQAEETDIAVAAQLTITRGTPETFREVQEPIFLIRDNQPYNIKSYSPATGIHCRFVKLDPDNGNITLWMAKQPDFNGMVIEVAPNFEREDYIVLETILFPGINLFWLGGILLMAGLGLGAWYRRTSNRAA
ncbi:MAG: cytochrome c biogenesis protein CcsA [Lewinellaceae bacterium]|nr:cytochrome c biogenesis protein CcsA [Saprospiraceae bacterium]MCB9311515.1 cytochrome c biogenesis protein CcsA [Lewinellaceae bacterium]HRW75374.1 cytochrome c biogenesis protein CcsA [Saprospiraceae bacterium]